VDTNTLEQLGEWKRKVEESGKPLVVIDHHAIHPDTQKTASLLLCDERATSACEVVLSLYRKFKRRPGKMEATALFCGIVFETGHLTIGTRVTFRNICWLVGQGVDPSKTQSMLRTGMDESERIARLKSAQRLVFERAGKWLLASSEVGSFQASAARALIALGAQVAVVGGDHQGKVSLSFRSTHDFQRETGIHLGADVAKTIGERFRGAGGGHATAAGANISAEASEALKESMRLIRELIDRPVK
jgi:nanoRNase/pAp phosphatase (c-di-AMP/oligoRNAs hydrolase)